MNKYIKQFLGTVLFLSIVVGIYTFGPRLLTGNKLLIRFTNSISFDARIYDIRQKTVPNYDYLAIGSSMTMNNLNSDVMMNYLGPMGENFYNCSAWGLSVQDMKNWMNVLLKKYQPKGIIMFGSMEDFDEVEQNYNYEDISRYLNGARQSSFYLEYGVFGDLSYYKEYEKLREGNNSYDSLNFDDNGGVILEVYGIDRAMNRWEKKFTEEFIQNNENYQSLYEMASELKKQGIDFYYVQMPSRQMYVTDTMGDEILNSHVERCREVVEGSGQYYYNAINYEKYSDDYFSDYTHMNEHGSLLITQEFLENVFIPSREHGNN